MAGRISIMSEMFSFVYAELGIGIEQCRSNIYILLML